MVVENQESKGNIAEKDSWDELLNEMIFTFLNFVNITLKLNYSKVHI